MGAGSPGQNGNNRRRRLVGGKEDFVSSLRLRSNSCIHLSLRMLPSRKISLTFKYTDGTDCSIVQALVDVIRLLVSHWRVFRECFAS